jgi:copper chaperone CopZ
VAPPPLALARRLRAARGPQALLLLLLSAAPAHAEYRRIELKILGMDCATCAHGVRVAMQKLDGVATVELSLERAQAEVGLEPDNRLTLDQFRQVVKRNGFEPKQAVVTALGTVRDAGGRMVFEVSGVPTPLVVSLDKSAPAALQQLKSVVSAKSAAVFEIVGTVEQARDGVESVAIASVKPRQ